MSSGKSMHVLSRLQQVVSNKLAAHCTHLGRVTVTVVKEIQVRVHCLRAGLSPLQRC